MILSTYVQNALISLSSLLDFSLLQIIYPFRLSEDWVVFSSCRPEDIIFVIFMFLVNYCVAPFKMYFMGCLVYIYLCSNVSAYISIIYCIYDTLCVQYLSILHNHCHGFRKPGNQNIYSHTPLFWFVTCFIENRSKSCLHVNEFHSS